jgi:segregation and condensation protein A
MGLATANNPSEPYQVSLDIFEGPLDLLLRLIERQVLDISRISLALVTDQYLAHVTLLGDTTAENLADFLVIAAKLLVIKSRFLLPTLVPDCDEEGEDVGEQLARQLIEYKRFKDAAARIRIIEQQGLHTYLRLAPSPKFERRPFNGHLAPQELLAILQRAFTSQMSLPPMDTVVAPEIVLISECIRTIRQLLAMESRLPLSRAIGSAHSRLEVIVLFLAVLELIKQQHVQVTQDNPFGEIYVEQRPSESKNIEIATDIEDYGESFTP